MTAGCCWTGRSSTPGEVVSLPTRVRSGSARTGWRSSASRQTETAYGTGSKDRCLRAARIFGGNWIGTAATD